MGISSEAGFGPTWAVIPMMTILLIIEETFNQ